MPYDGFNKPFPGEKPLDETGVENVLASAIGQVLKSIVTVKYKAVNEISCYKSGFTADVEVHGLKMSLKQMGEIYFKVRFQPHGFVPTHFSFSGGNTDKNPTIAFITFEYTAKPFEPTAVMKLCSELQDRAGADNCFLKTMSIGEGHVVTLVFDKKQGQLIESTMLAVVNETCTVRGYPVQSVVGPVPWPEGGPEDYAYHFEINEEGANAPGKVNALAPKQKLYGISPFEKFVAPDIKPSLTEQVTENINELAQIFATFFSGSLTGIKVSYEGDCYYVNAFLLKDFQPTLTDIQDACKPTFSMVNYEIQKEAHEGDAVWYKFEQFKAPSYESAIKKIVEKKYEDYLMTDTLTGKEELISKDVLEKIKVSAEQDAQKFLQQQAHLRHLISSVVEQACQDIEGLAYIGNEETSIVTQTVSMDVYMTASKVDTAMKLDQVLQKQGLKLSNFLSSESADPEKFRISVTRMSILESSNELFKKGVAEDSKKGDLFEKMKEAVGTMSPVLKKNLFDQEYLGDFEVQAHKFVIGVDMAKPGAETTTLMKKAYKTKDGKMVFAAKAQLPVKKGDKLVVNGTGEVVPAKSADFVAQVIGEALNSGEEGDLIHVQLYPQDIPKDVTTDVPKGTKWMTAANDIEVNELVYMSGVGMVSTMKHGVQVQPIGVAATGAVKGSKVLVIIGISAMAAMPTTTVGANAIMSTHPARERMILGADGSITMKDRDGKVFFRILADGKFSVNGDLLLDKGGSVTGMQHLAEQFWELLAELNPMRSQLFKAMAKLQFYEEGLKKMSNEKIALQLTLEKLQYEVKGKYVERAEDDARVARFKNVADNIENDPPAQ